MKKSIKNQVTFLLIVSTVFNLSCVFDKTDNKLKVFNNTGKNFYLKLKEDTVLLLEDIGHMNEKSRFNVIKANDTCIPLFAFKTHGGYIRKINKECIDSTMFLYLFEIDSVKKYGWDLIIKNDDMFIRKGFKIKDLDSINWFIKIKSLTK